MNKTDLLIYCDWLTDKNIDVNILRLISSHINNGIIGVNRLSIDINSDGYGYGDSGYCCDSGNGGIGNNDGGFGYGNMYGNGAGDGDGFGYGDMYGYSDVHGYSNSGNDGYSCGFDCNRNRQ